MIAFASACASIAETSSKLEKVARLAAYLRAQHGPDLAAATRFFTADPFGAHEQRRLSVGGRTIVKAAENVWGIDGRSLGAAYRSTGDIGAALGQFVRPAVDLGLFRETLTPAALKMLLDEVADSTGPAAGKRRLWLCERILRACTTELEACYVIKLLAGELRIGLREALVVEAIAVAFDRPLAEVRRAVMAAGDIGEVAVAAKDDRLADVAVRYGAPLGFMLATPIPYGNAYRDLAAGSWMIDDKYDGIRAQAHKHQSEVRLFSRTLSDIRHSFPEIAADLARSPHDVILDGEIVARRNGRVLPFRYLQTRLQRKDPTQQLIAEIPVTFFAFDLLAAGKTFLLDVPLIERRARLAGSLVPAEHLSIAPWHVLPDGTSSEDVNAAFEAARARGNEGLMLKRTDSPYAPGRRGKWWLKLKRELSTLDAVVVAVEWGHGKRHGVLSDYTFAVRAGADDERLLAIGKAYSGLTDREISELTNWFLEHRLPVSAQRSQARAYEIPVEPNIVIEVAFDIIQKSTLHDSGYALRFPRIVRLRPDKSPEEIDTLVDVERIYAEMLAREGVVH
ncbi:MAG: ATP-dependent DNA ligase [Candidatus Eremiobacteraeota bacterium]|nr:ATP-dependent DNA ligase [Candidatus Eremiobacteraeota bacterium]